MQQCKVFIRMGEDFEQYEDAHDEPLRKISTNQTSYSPWALWSLVSFRSCETWLYACSSQFQHSALSEPSHSRKHLQFLQLRSIAFSSPSFESVAAFQFWNPLLKKTDYIIFGNNQYTQLNPVPAHIFGLASILLSRVCFNFHLTSLKFNSVAELHLVNHISPC